MIPIALCFGNENQVAASFKVQIFSMEMVNGSPGEMHITQLPDSTLRVHSKDSAPARPNVGWQEGGGWTELQGEIEEGTILKVFVTRKCHNALPARAACFFRVRANASTIQVNNPGINYMDSTRSSVACILGKIDKISLAEARAAGYITSSSYDKFFNSIDEEDLFQLHTIHQGTELPPVQVCEVETAAGEVKQVIRPREELRRVRKRRKENG